MTKKRKYSLIFPVFNEEDNIAPLYKQLKPVLDSLSDYEVIFIDDGSTDRTFLNLDKIRRGNRSVRVIQFTRNFGQTAALAAGFDLAQGEIIITLDADMQNDPKDIPRLIRLLKVKKADIVTGWRKKRTDPLARSLVSVLANKIINWFTDSQFHDLGCTLRVYRKKALLGLSLYGEMHRFIPILAQINGAKIIETPVAHHPRRYGQSKYGFKRTFKVLLDLITLKFLSGYQTKPIYMFGSAGIGFLSLSFVAGLFIVIRRFFFQGAWVSPMLFIAIALFNTGVTCVLMGLLAEIQIRTWFESSNRKSYLIKKVD